MADWIAPFGTPPNTSFVNGDPDNGSPIPAEFFEKWQTWLLAIIDAAGLTRDALDDNQMVDAIQALIDASGFSIPALPDHAGAAADGDELAIAVGGVGGVEKKITVAELFLGRANFDQVARDQIAVANLRQIVNTSVTSSALVQGWQYGFDTDEWGVTSTSETFISGSPGYYASQAGTAQIAQAAGTVIGDMTGNGGNAAAFDGSTSQTLAACAQNTGSACFIGKNWGSPKTIAQFKFYGPSNSDPFGSSTPTLKLQGSNDGTNWTDLYSETLGGLLGMAWVKTVSAGINTSQAYTYHRVYLNGFGGSNAYCAEVQFFEVLTPANMTLLPPAPVTLSEVPPAAVLFFLWKDDSGAAVLGTDVTVELSRDGGATWTVATLVNRASFDGTYSVIRARADLSAQPSGTSLTCRIKTLNTKAQRIAAPAIYAE
ncbi:MAG: hypothetical protein HQL42_13020 [Alphaproteobacteria bacterium]|nr:hypothetical protein [Alphaproteobacteria bacterium]